MSAMLRGQEPWEISTVTRFLAILMVTSFMWTPLPFAAYAIVRRRLSIALVVAFLVAESIALGAYLLFVSNMK